MDRKLIQDVLDHLERHRAETDALISDIRLAHDVATDRPASGRWTTEDDSRITKLTEAGRTHEEIAPLVGRTVHAVSKRLSRLAGAD